MSHMADDNKPKRLPPKRPDRELYVPRCRKPTVQSLKSNHIMIKGDSASSKLVKSHDLLPGSKGDEEKRRYHMVNVDCDGDHMSTAVCNNKSASDGKGNAAEFQESGEGFGSPRYSGGENTGEVESVTEKDESVANSYVCTVSSGVDKPSVISGGESINDECKIDDFSGIRKTESDAFQCTRKAESDYESNNEVKAPFSEPLVAKANSSNDLETRESLTHCKTAERDIQSVSRTKENMVHGTKEGACSVYMNKRHSTNKEKTLNEGDGENCMYVKSRRKVKVYKKQTRDKDTSVKKETKGNSASGTVSVMEKECMNDDSETVGDDDWFDKWDETGNCLSEEAKDELAKLTEIKDPIILEAKKPEIDYYSFNPTVPNLEEKDFNHLAEVYDFSPDLTTTDLSLALQAIGLKDFDIKWVDDTHAIGVFSTAFQAQQAIQSPNLLLKIRPVTEGTKETQLKVNSFKNMLLPYKSRPETTVAVARNLVTSALGMKTNTTKEQRAAERQKIVAARERKKQKERIAKDAWGD